MSGEQILLPDHQTAARYDAAQLVVDFAEHVLEINRHRTLPGHCPSEMALLDRAEYYRIILRRKANK